ncbi:MAG: hypothetical protein K6B14_02820 [Lachnospiraceae bacterium]|nr:hypothetical protein [Lachnospiraceae bacterium]
MSGISQVGSITATYAATTAKPADKTTEKETTKKPATDSYEKSADTTNEKKATYSINQKSEADRAAIVEKMKADQQHNLDNMQSLVKKMFEGQGKSYSLAFEDDSIWKFLAEGKFEVDAATKAQAQEDISEDGYWGVKQTSQRLFDFASALAGDDPEKMKEMQKAIEKGYQEATGAWGRDLPEISSQTMDATNKLFEDYYASKNS